MSRNVLVHAAGSGACACAANLAAGAGDDLGLVLTTIELHHEKVSGGRIEESREYAGIRFNAFDEPVFIGSAIAQLAGHAEAVIVDGIEEWAERLLQRFPDDPIELDAEISSLRSVLHARMADVILVCRADRSRSPAGRTLLERIVPTLESDADLVIDARGSEPRALKGDFRG
jgi:adenosyl cobinamide kinase/adenosyl cobinamide phosphate guanylyltransferase